jgi:hypothetical protein
MATAAGREERTRDSAVRDLAVRDMVMLSNQVQVGKFDVGDVGDVGDVVTW